MPIPPKWRVFGPRERANPHWAFFHAEGAKNLFERSEKEKREKRRKRREEREKERKREEREREEREREERERERKEEKRREKEKRRKRGEERVREGRGVARMRGHLVGHFTPKSLPWLRKHGVTQPFGRFTRAVKSCLLVTYKSVRTNLKPSQEPLGTWCTRT